MSDIMVSYNSVVDHRSRPLTLNNITDQTLHYYITNHHLDSKVFTICLHNYSMYINYIKTAFHQQLLMGYNSITNRNIS